MKENKEIRDCFIVLQTLSSEAHVQINFESCKLIHLSQVHL